MHSPEWVENRDGWEVAPEWYKRVVFRLIIDPVDTFYTWKYWKIDSRWHDFKNAIMRVKKGYDYSHVWNMNDWFIEGAVGILETWLEAEDCPMGSPVIDTENGDAMDYDEWVSILNEMLEGFKLWQTYEGGGEFPEIVPDIYDSGTYNFSPARKIAGGNTCRVVAMFGEESQSCWKDGAHYMTFEGVWHKCSMSNEEQKKYQRALDLFAKYHAALWD